MAEFKVGQPVKISGHSDFTEGVIHKIDRNMTGGPAYVVRINRRQQVPHEWGVNCVLIDTHKLSVI